LRAQTLERIRGEFISLEALEPYRTKRSAQWPLAGYHHETFSVGNGWLSSRIRKMKPRETRQKRPQVRQGSRNIIGEQVRNWQRWMGSQENQYTRKGIGIDQPALANSSRARFADLAGPSMAWPGENAGLRSAATVSGSHRRSDNAARSPRILGFGSRIGNALRQQSDRPGGDGLAQQPAEGIRLRPYCARVRSSRTTLAVS